MGAQAKCEICDFQSHYLAEHLKQVHALSVEDYLTRYPDSGVVSDTLMTEWESQGQFRREPPPMPEALRLVFAGASFPVNVDVPEDACLPLPDYYMIPTDDALGRDVHHAAVALANHRSMYIWGMPGSGKDAFFHAWSALTRSPAKPFPIQPGLDIQSWFYSRTFSATSTMWEEGELLTALRDGYKSPISGRVIPYLILLSDMDRADPRSQTEALRLIMDSISGRIKGPRGETYKVLPGTRIVATGNTSGSGDPRGRMISANSIDAAMFDRFERKFEFHWMGWKDEEKIAIQKFPFLAEQYPDCFREVGASTTALREAIKLNTLYGEFSHRAVCAWLGHAQDLLLSGEPKKNLLIKAAKAFLDGLPDEASKLTAQRLIDPSLSGGAI